MAGRGPRRLRPLGLPLADLIYEEMKKRGLTCELLATALRKGSEKGQESQASKQSVSDWCNGRYTPGALHVRLLATVFELRVEQVAAAAERQRQMAYSARTRPVMATTASQLGTPEAISPEVVDSEEDVRRRVFLQQLALLSGAAALGDADWLGAMEHHLVTAARESRDHAGLVASQSVHPTSIDLLHGDIVRIAGRYWRTAPHLSYVDAKRVHDLAFGLLARTSRPDQGHDLYLLMGAACGLLASATFDLGSLTAAAEHARSASILGAHVGHNGLSAWAGGMEALIAYWSGRPLEAIDLAHRAQPQAPLGTAQVRLYCIEARAWSHVGDMDQMTRAVVAAAGAREKANGADELHDQIGGEFGFDPARQFFCTGTAYLQVDAPEDAIAQTQRAIDLYVKMPAEERSPAFESQAQTDLATGFLMRSDLDGARAALRPVFMLSPEYRIGGLVRRLGRVHEILARGPHATLPEPRRLSEEIKSFTSDTVASGFRLGRK